MNDSASNLLFRIFILCGVLLPPSLLQGAEEKVSPPKWTYSFPAGAARGQATTITASGDFPRWPLQVWSDHPAVQAKAAKEKGKLEVTVSADAPGGVAWLRLYDHAGASVLRPLVISTLPETLEKEPNDDLSQPQLVVRATTINGRLEKRGDVDTYAIELFQGQTLIASLQANRLLASPMDSILQVCTSDGFVLTQNDDALGLDPQIVFTAQADGNYLVRTFAFPATPNSTIGFAGNAQYVYRLTLTTGGFLDHAFPLALSRSKPTELQLQGWNLSASDQKLRFSPASLTDKDFVVITVPETAGALRLPLVKHSLATAESWNSPSRPQAISLPVTITGRLGQQQQKHAYVFHARKDQSLTFRIEAHELGYLLDPKMTIADSSGKIISEVDDTGGSNRDGQINFQAKADGKYTLTISDLHGHGGFRYVYRLTAEPAQPSYSLSLAAGEFVATVGKPLEIPIAISRTGGFQEEIAISAVGLPEGVTAEPIVSLPKGDTAKTVKLKIEPGKEPFSGVIKIAGKALKQQSLARFTLTQPNHQHTRVWLTVIKPSLMDKEAKKTEK